MSDKELEDKIKTILGGVPTEIRKDLEDRVNFYISKKGVFTNEEIIEEIKYLVDLAMLAYRDSRKYLSLYNRKFSEHKIIETILKIMSLKNLKEEALYSLGRVNFDLNGLKALNDLAGHDAGNRGLELFANMLKEGKTTTWLRGHGVKIIVSAEGGDEFGMVIISKSDLRPVRQELVDRFVQETREIDATSFINFESDDVQKNLHLLKIADEIPKDFRFELSSSVGIALLGEALSNTDVSVPDSSYLEIVGKLAKKMLEIADKRSMVHKSVYKEELDKTNPILSGLYSRMSKEVIHLEKELIKRGEKIIQLEARLSLHDRLNNKDQ